MAARRIAGSHSVLIPRKTPELVEPVIFEQFLVWKVLYPCLPRKQDRVGERAMTVLRSASVKSPRLKAVSRSSLARLNRPRAFRSSPFRLRFSAFCGLFALSAKKYACALSARAYNVYRAGVRSSSRSHRIRYPECQRIGSTWEQFRV